jgi:hypothetical protein
MGCIQSSGSCLPCFGRLPFVLTFFFFFFFFFFFSPFFWFPFGRTKPLCTKHFIGSVRGDQAVEKSGGVAFEAGSDLSFLFIFSSFFFLLFFSFFLLSDAVRLGGACGE